MVVNLELKEALKKAHVNYLTREGDMVKYMVVYKGKEYFTEPLKEVEVVKEIKGRGLYFRVGIKEVSREDKKNALNELKKQIMLKKKNK